MFDEIVGVNKTTLLEATQSITDNTNVVDFAFAPPLLIIYPVKVTVYTPAALGTFQATIRVTVSNVINVVL